MKSINVVFAVILCLSLLACSDKQSGSEAYNNSDTVISLSQITLSPKPMTKRWYFSEQATRGKNIFINNCAACHGKNAEATSNWKTPDANGHYPPPPLNGSAHAWHHPLSVLGRTIYNGGAEVGGQMPAFKDQLSESDIIDVIAYFQTYWSDGIYERWLMIEKSSR